MSYDEPSEQCRLHGDTLDLVSEFNVPDRHRMPVGIETFLSVRKAVVPVLPYLGMRHALDVGDAFGAGVLSLLQLLRLEFPEPLHGT